MQKDYPKANARLSEVAKHWAEGEVSHETWRKERRTIIEALMAGGRDWLQSDSIVKKASSLSRTTLPTVSIPMPLAAAYPAGHAVLAQSEVSNEDVLMLAVLLFVMITTAIILLYIL